MRLFFYNSISLTALVSLIGCATSPWKLERMSLEKYRALKVGLYDADRPDKLLNGQDGLFPDLSETTSPESAISSYCVGDKPRKKLAHNITVIIPRAPKNKPVDTVANYRRMYIRSVKEYLRSFYSIISKRSKFSKKYVHSARSEDIVYYSVPKEVLSNPTAATNSLSYRNNLTFLLRNEKEIYLSDWEGLKVTYKIGTSILILQEPTLVKAPLPNKVYAYPITSIKHYSSKGSRSTKYKDEAQETIREVLPVRDISLGTSRFFREHLTLNLPKPVQDIVFANYRNSSKFYGYRNQSDRVTASQLNADNDLLWDAFFYRNTRVSEGTPIDANTIPFTVELNLSLFCRHSLPLEDLLSK